MPKLYDVHFNITFADTIRVYVADSKEHATEIAIAVLPELLVERIQKQIVCGGGVVDITGVQEFTVGEE